MPARRDSMTRAAVLAGAIMMMASSAIAAPAPDGGVTLKAGAGIGGVSKPGRWTPVRVSATAGAESIDGDITIEWGAASLRRPIVLAPGSSKQFEFYLQTMEVGGSVSAKLVANGRDLAAAAAEIRALRANEPFTLCVTVPGGGGTASAGECTTTTTLETLPRSPRGYDAADRLVWLSGDETLLTPEQRTGLRRWRALRALEDHGDLAAAQRPRSIMPSLSRQNRTGLSLRIWMTAYLTALLGVSYIVAARRARALIGYTTVGLLVALGTSAALASGRRGSDASVVVHHATLVHQLADGSGSIIEMRGAAAYPAFDFFEVRAVLADAAFESEARASARTQQIIDAEGYPVIVGTFGLGGRQAFSLYGISDFRPLTVTRADSVTRVANVSSQDLHECRFPDAAADRAPATLAAGAMMEAELPADIVGPVITCLMAQPPVAFAETRRSVVTKGRAVIAAYLPPAGNEP